MVYSKLPARYLTTKNWQYCASASGSLCGIALLVSLLTPMIILPVPAWWDAQRVHDHYFSRITGTQVGSLFLGIAGPLYISYSALVTKQMRWIPDLDPIIPDLQLALGTAGMVAYLIPAMVLALITFRDYGAEMTMFLNDVFWITLLFPWPIFTLQWWTIAWAAFADPGPRLVFPRTMAWLNLVTPIVISLAAGLHMHHTGPFAWNGGLVWWPTFVSLFLELNIDGYILFRNIRYRSDLQDGGGRLIGRGSEP